MGVVLAIDPGRRQTKAIERLTADLAGHEVLVAASGDEAIDLLDRHVPDLLLFPIGLSPSDEARLRARLDGLGRPTDLKALTLPLRAFLDAEHQASRPTAAPPRWFYWFKPATAVDYDVDDPRRFADAVRSDLDRPRAAAAPRALDEVPEPPLVAHARQNEQSDHRQPWQTASSAPSTSDGPGGADAIAFDSRPASDPGADAWAAPADPFAGAAAAASVAETLSSPSTAPGSLQAFEPPALEDGEPRPGRISVLVSAAAGMAARAAASLGPAAAAAWRIARTMPRPVQVAAPVLIILLTLGVTGRAGAMLRAPVRWAAATKARFFPDKPRTGTAEIQSVPDGAEVWMEGRQIGVTPLRAEFAVGSHEVELRHKGTTRSLI
ncbi:MAG: PEGA domain-containing protein, partial [Vicinamibacterales bacterium]